MFRPGVVRKEHFVFSRKFRKSSWQTPQSLFSTRRRIERCERRLARMLRRPSVLGWLALRQMLDSQKLPHRTNSIDCQYVGKGDAQTKDTHTARKAGKKLNNSEQE